jgi:hypothetical protein
MAGIDDNGRPERPGQRRASGQHPRVPRGAGADRFARQRRMLMKGSIMAARQGDEGQCRCARGLREMPLASQGITGGRVRRQ